MPDLWRLRSINALSRRSKWINTGKYQTRQLWVPKKAEDNFLSQKIDSMTPPSHQIDIAHHIRQNGRRTVPLRFQKRLLPAVMINITKRGEWNSIVAGNAIVFQHFWHASEIVPSPASEFWYKLTGGIRTSLTTTCILSFTSCRDAMIT